NKKELALWKEVTKNDEKINTYISDNMVEKNENSNEKGKKQQIKSINVNDYKFQLANESNEQNYKQETGDQKLQINKRMKSKLERGLIRPEATLDLHGFTRVKAKEALRLFINACIHEEKRCILIVTGKKKSTLGSRSVLRELVPDWLNEKCYTYLILAHSYAIQKDGGDGARYILLRKRKLINE
ncbi:MAG: Smr/MutS family protein, partial [Pseudomonadota bacterium]|nr:Smr/MutS family protein [Pseudomonadota bacterium]